MNMSMQCASVVSVKKLPLQKRKMYRFPKETPIQRDIIAQVRDWLHNQGLVEKLSSDCLHGYWTLNGRLVFTVSSIEHGACQITISSLESRMINTSVIDYRLPDNFTVTSGVGLHALKPVLRLALPTSEGRRLENVALARSRATQGVYDGWFLPTSGSWRVW